MWVKRKRTPDRSHGSAKPQPREEVQGADDNRCGCLHDQLPTVESRTQDRPEIAIVYLCRYAFGALCEHDVRYWSRGFDVATQTFGEDRGLAIFTRLIALARHIQSDRLGSFNFQSVNCSRMAPDEELVLGAIQWSRRGDAFEFQQSVLTLANGGRTDRLSDAAKVIGTMLRFFEMEEAPQNDVPTAAPETRH